MDRTPKPGEKYRHFKNKLYQIVAIAQHSETKERLVIYQALYGDFGVYARPLEMFVSEVDHAKYPEVTQKYRFERVDTPEAAAARLQIESMQKPETQPAGETAGAATGTVSEPGETVNPKFMEFLDAETFDEKYNILVSMRDEITDQLIDSIAVVMDVSIPEGELTKRYDNLKDAIRTRRKYEYANRLR
jgi:hypothetical protein